MAFRHSEYLMSPFETVLKDSLLRDKSPIEKRGNENFRFIASSFKVASTMMLEYVPNIINLFYVGNMCEIEVQSAYGLVIVLTFCLGFGFYEGLAAGMESFLASIKTDLSIVIYQRVLLLGSFMMVPIIVILLLFKWVIFPWVVPEVSDLAGKMAIGLSFSIYFNSLYLISRSLLNSRQKYNQQLVSNIATIVFHIASCEVVFRYFGWSVYGAIITRTFCDIFNFNLFFNISKLKQDVQFEHFSACTITELKTVARILIPKGFVILLQIIAFESFAFQAAGIGLYNISSHIIATNIHNFGYFLLSGISIVAYISVSNCIMDNEIKAKRLIKKGMISLLIVTLMFAAFLSWFPWRTLMADIPQVVETLKTIAGLQILFLIFDALQVYISSISRTMGKHKEAIKHFILSYFVIGQTLCFILRHLYPSLQLKAVWISMIVSVIVYDIWQGKILLSSTINQARRLIQQQIQEQQANDSIMLDEYIEGTRDWTKYHSTQY